MKVISGGQTGIDRMGLEVAKQLGMETGGMAPKDYWTEVGSDPSLKEFGLTEDLVRGYMPRTIHNINVSDGTVIFGDERSPGSRNTCSYCKLLKKPFIINPNVSQLWHFITLNRIQILNVAGNRASKLTQEQIEMYRTILYDTLKEFINLRTRI